VRAPAGAPDVIEHQVHDRLVQVGPQRTFSPIFETIEVDDRPLHRVLDEVVRVGHVARESRQPSVCPPAQLGEVPFEQHAESL
jgi:hypothetical protein